MKPLLRNMRKIMLPNILFRNKCRLEMARLFALTERFEEAILIYEELGRSQPKIHHYTVHLQPPPPPPQLRVKKKMFQVLLIWADKKTVNPPPKKKILQTPSWRK